MFHIIVDGPSMLQRVVDAVLSLKGDYHYCGRFTLAVKVPGKTPSDVIAAANALA